MSEDRRTRVRAAHQWPVVVWLVAVWVLLWGDLTVANVLGGTVVALGVITVFPLPPLHWTGTVRPLPLLWLVARFLADVVRASGQIAWLALTPHYRPRNAIIEVRLRSRGDAYFLLTAELVSLVPGSLVLETDYRRHTLYLHIIDTQDMADVELARRRVWEQEARVVRALASAAELAELDRRALEETR
jgi:multicomponent Na+:H+ antiporter subunit E